MHDLISNAATRIAAHEYKRQPFAWSPAQKSLLESARNLIGEGLIGLGQRIKPKSVEHQPNLKAQWQGR